MAHSSSRGTWSENIAPSRTEAVQNSTGSKRPTDADDAPRMDPNASRIARALVMTKTPHVDDQSLHHAVPANVALIAVKPVAKRQCRIEQRADFSPSMMGSSSCCKNLSKSTA